MLDWSKIDTWQKFQELTNSLFCREIFDPGFFKPSSSRIGADGGWDGKYEGLYPPENLKGVYSIQSKHSNQTGQALVAHLKGEIEKELGNAKKNDVAHLRISTSGELTVGQAEELEKLAAGTSISLKIWYRAQLEERLKNFPFLQQYYFGNPQYPAFVPFEVYMKATEPNLTEFSYLEFSRFSNYLLEVEKFLVDIQKDLLVSHAPGGYGKSHFLREIGKNFHQLDSSREVLFVRSGRDITKALQEELLGTRKYLLVFDDAERNLEEVRPLLDFLWSKSLDLKIILSLRSSGFFIVDQEILNKRLKPRAQEIHIGHWNEEELIKLLRITSGKNPVKDEEEIVRELNNPYLIVLLGQKLKTGATITREQLKEKLVSDLVYDVQKSLGDISKQIDVEAFLVVLAAIAPFNIEIQKVLKKLSHDFKVSEEVVVKIVGMLEKSGVLRKIGRNFRFNPDMKGDLLLSDRLGKLEESQLKNLILDWSVIAPENIFSNVGASFVAEEDKSKVQNILGAIIGEWISEASSSEDWIKRKNLELLSKVSFLVPKEALNLLAVYLAETVRTKGSLTTDNFGPVILSLINVEGIERDLLGIIERLSEAGIVGTYANYKVDELMEKFLSPLHHSIESVIDRLSLLSQLVKSPTPARALILRDGLFEILGSTHRVHRSYINKIEFGERALLKTPKSLEMRAIGIKIVEDMLLSKNKDMIAAALAVLEELGRGNMGHIANADVPLATEFPKERRNIIALIKKLISEESDLIILNQYEDLLIRWWAQETPGAESVEEILKAYPRSPEYLLVRNLFSREYVVEDFTELLKKVPAGEDRWRWFVQEVMSARWDREAKDFENLIQKLDKIYRDEKEILSVLKLVGQDLNGSETDYPALVFFQAWVKINQKTFSKIRDSKELWDHVPPLFKQSIDEALALVDVTHIKKIEQEVLAGLPGVSVSRAAQLVRLSIKLSDAERDSILETLIKKGSNQIRSHVLFSLNWIYKTEKNIQKIADRISMILDQDVDVRALDNLSFVLHQLKDDFNAVPALKKALYGKILDVLRDYPDLSEHCDEIIEVCTEDFEQLLEFIAYRLQKDRAANDDTDFRAIPYEGMSKLKNLINSYEDFKKLMYQTALHKEAETRWKDLDLEHLLDPIASKQDELSKKPYLNEFIEELLSQKSTKEALICGQFLPLSEENIELFLKLAAAGISDGLSKEVRSLLFSKQFLKRGYSSTLGVVPPGLVSQRKIFENMLNKTTPGELRDLIGKCIESVDSLIKDWMDHDQEVLNR